MNGYPRCPCRLPPSVSDRGTVVGQAQPILEGRTVSAIATLLKIIIEECLQQDYGSEARPSYDCLDGFRRYLVFFHPACRIWLSLSMVACASGFSAMLTFSNGSVAWSNSIL